VTSAWVGHHRPLDPDEEFTETVVKSRAMMDSPLDATGRRRAEVSSAPTIGARRSRRLRSGGVHCSQSAARNHGQRHLSSSTAPSLGLTTVSPLRSWRYQRSRRGGGRQVVPKHRRRPDVPCPSRGTVAIGRMVGNTAARRPHRRHAFSEVTGGPRPASRRHDRGQAEALSLNRLAPSLGFSPVIRWPRWSVPKVSRGAPCAN